MMEKPVGSTERGVFSPCFQVVPIEISKVKAEAEKLQPKEAAEAAGHHTVEGNFRWEDFPWDFPVSFLGGKHFNDPVWLVMD